MRIDLTPSTAQPSSQRLAIATPALRSSSSGPARLVGALFEMCWHFTPVFAIFVAIRSSHLRPDGLIGSNVPAGEHRVVRDVAEQAREDVHVGDARERVLGELREVQHGDLAVLLLHLLRSSSRHWMASAARRRGSVAPAGQPRPQPAPLSRSAGRRRPARRLLPPAPGAALPRPAPPRPPAPAPGGRLLKIVANRPSARRDAGEPILVGAELSASAALPDSARGSPPSTLPPPRERNRGDRCPCRPCLWCCSSLLPDWRGRPPAPPPPRGPEMSSRCGETSP